MPCPLVLCTDFGPGSPYVGQMKLVIAAAAPELRVVDLAHDLPPQEIVAAALVVSAALRTVPRPAVLCAVIDPGVGSNRRIVAVDDGHGLTLIVPDNGLATVVRDPARVYAVEARELFRDPVSPVFHGRDVFAPVAAALAMDLPLERVGPQVDPADLRSLPQPLFATAESAEIIYVDRFGNLISNLHRDDVPPDCIGASLEGRPAQRVTTYSDGPAGALVCLVGSYDRLEIAIRNGSAARELEVGPGARFKVERATPPSDEHST